jgi:putative DNA primase/helicase
MAHRAISHAAGIVTAVPELPEALTVYPPPSDQMAVARRIISDHNFRNRDGILTVRWWRGDFYFYSGDHWVVVSDPVVQSQLYTILENVHFVKGKVPVPWEPTRNKIHNVVDALRSIVILPEHTEPPAWIEGDDDGRVLATANVLLRLNTRTTIRHTPRLFNQFALPHAYEHDAPEPVRWLNFLHDLWGDDEESIELLQQWFGYTLSGATNLHKILLLVGPPRSGKGTIARVLTALVGKENTAGPTLASLGANFGLSPLLGKAVAIISDARLGGNTFTTVERLLSISGEDSLTVDRKYKEPWTGRLPVRFTVISNELPNLGDASGAVATRFVVLLLEKSWLGKENENLTDELLEELPGILNWSMDGLDRLRKRRHFTEPQSSKDAVIELQDLSSPVAAFVRECCERGPYEIEIDELYLEWRAWCEAQGRTKISTKQRFGRDLRAVIPGLKVIQHPRRYRGLRLRDGGDQDGDDRVPARSWRQGNAQERDPGHSKSDLDAAFLALAPLRPTVIGVRMNAQERDHPHSRSHWEEDP